MLRAEYRTRIPVRRLAKTAGMSLTAFHVQFKQLTSLTPIQFQKRLRLMEARRLMVHEGVSATAAAFEVGYESASQFSREYARLFGAPPKRDALRARSAPLPGASARRQAAISASNREQLAVHEPVHDMVVLRPARPMSGFSNQRSRARDMNTT